MQITRTTSTKYYLLSVLGALMVAVGVLIGAPSAQAQVQPVEPPTLDKECTPNPVQVGQTLTCSFTVTLAPRSGAIVTFFADTFPSGIRPISVLDRRNCMVDGQTVTCPGIFSAFTTIQDVPETFLLNTVDAIAEQCGTFRNTAEIRGVFGGIVGPLLPFTAADTEDITVEGCEEAGGGGAGGGGGAAPITQEGEQESESGEIDQSFDIS